MEDVALFVKDFDNSGLRRAADPSARRAWARMIAVCGLLLLIVMACFGPRAWLRHSGYRQAELAAERQEMDGLQRQLQVRHERLSDLRRVARMASARGLVTPGAESVAWQNLTIPPDGDEGVLAGSFVEAR